MGQPLFQFTDSFIGSVCYGMDDDAVEGRLVEAIEAGRQVVRTGVQTSVSRRWSPSLVDEIDVVAENGGFTVIVPEEVREDVLNDEYGLAGESPTPVLRQGVIASRIDAQRAISAVLEQR